MKNMKNIFGVLSDAFANASNALFSLLAIVNKIARRQQVEDFRTSLRNSNTESILLEKDKTEFFDFVHQFTNNTYQISSLIVVLFKFA